MRTNALEHVSDEFHLPKLIPAEKVNMHIDALLHWGDLRVYAPDIEERSGIAPPENGSKALAEC